MRNERVMLSNFRLFLVAKIYKLYECEMNSTGTVLQGKAYYIIKEDERDYNKAIKQVRVELIRSDCAVFQEFGLVFVRVTNMYYMEILINLITTCEDQMDDGHGRNLKGCESTKQMLSNFNPPL